MMFLRSLIFNIVMFGSGFILSCWALVLTYLVPTPKRLLGIAQLWAAITVVALRRICGIGISVIGRDQLPTAGGALIAAQHQSTLDVMVWLRLLPRPAYVLKRELTRIPGFGTALLPAGMVAVNRGGGSVTLQKMVEDCQTAIAAGHQIVIFPEGTRVAPGQRAALRSGIVALAKALNMAVIPAATNSGLHWGRRAFAKTPGTVKVKIYPPISPNLSREEMLAQLAEYFYGSGVG